MPQDHCYVILDRKDARELLGQKCLLKDHFTIQASDSGKKGAVSCRLGNPDEIRKLPDEKGKWLGLSSVVEWTVTDEGEADILKSHYQVPVGMLKIKAGGKRKLKSAYRESLFQPETAEGEVFRYMAYRRGLLASFEQTFVTAGDLPDWFGWTCARSQLPAWIAPFLDRFQGTGKFPEVAMSQKYSREKLLTLRFIYALELFGKAYFADGKMEPTAKEWLFHLKPEWFSKERARRESEEFDGLKEGDFLFKPVPEVFLQDADFILALLLAIRFSDEIESLQPKEVETFLLNSPGFSETKLDSSRILRAFAFLRGFFLPEYQSYWPTDISRGLVCWMERLAYAWAIGEENTDHHASEELVKEWAGVQELYLKKDKKAARKRYDAYARVLTPPKKRVPRSQKEDPIWIQVDGGRKTHLLLLASEIYPRRTIDLIRAFPGLEKVLLIRKTRLPADFELTTEESLRRNQFLASLRENLDEVAPEVELFLSWQDVARPKPAVFQRVIRSFIQGADPGRIFVLNDTKPGSEEAEREKGWILAGLQPVPPFDPEHAYLFVD